MRKRGSGPIRGAAVHPPDATGGAFRLGMRRRELMSHYPKRPSALEIRAGSMRKRAGSFELTRCEHARRPRLNRTLRTWETDRRDDRRAVVVGCVSCVSRPPTRFVGVLARPSRPGGMLLASSWGRRRRADAREGSARSCRLLFSPLQCYVNSYGLHTARDQTGQVPLFHTSMTGPCTVLYGFGTRNHRMTMRMTACLFTSV